MASLFDDIFAHPRPAQNQPHSGNPFMRDPSTLEDEHVIVLGSSPPHEIQRRGTIRSHHRTTSGSTVHTHQSSTARRNSGVRGHTRQLSGQRSVAHEAIPVDRERLPPIDEPGEQGTLDRKHTHHLPQATLPKRSHSADEIAVTLPSHPTTTSDDPTIPSDDDAQSIRTSEETISPIPDDNHNYHRTSAIDNEITYFEGNQPNIIAGLAAIMGGSSKRKNPSDNEFTVRSAPPTLISERKNSYCSTCDGGGGTLFRSDTKAYDRYKDRRSEHTIISGIDRVDSLKKRDFLMKLSRAFASYGAPSHRLEFHLRTVSEALDIESHFVAFPGLIMISFGNEDHSSSTHLVKAPQGFNMAKLSAVNLLCLDLVNGTVLIDEALARLNDIRLATEYSQLVFLSTFPVVSFGISIIGFGASWVEAGVSAALGLLVGCLCLLAEKYPSFTYLLEFVSALIVGLLVRAYKSVAGNECLNHTVITLSALAVLLPGLSLTISIIEISTRNMVSGTVRMFHALFTAMLLGFGMSVGPLLWDHDSPTKQPTDCPPNEHISPYWDFLLFPAMSVCICIFFQARPRQWIVMTAVSAIGFVTYYFLNQIPSFQKNGQLPMVLSALVIGLASNIYARVTNDVAVAPILAGILLLVPGSVGVRSTLGFLGGASSDGTNFAFQMLIIGISITIGLFVATLLVWPIRGPKLKYMMTI